MHVWSTYRIYPCLRLVLHKTFTIHLVKFLEVKKINSTDQQYLTFKQNYTTYENNAEQQISSKLLLSRLNFTTVKFQWSENRKRSTISHRMQTTLRHYRNTVWRLTVERFNIEHRFCKTVKDGCTQFISI